MDETKDSVRRTRGEETSASSAGYSKTDCPGRETRRPKPTRFGAQLWDWLAGMVLLVTSTNPFRSRLTFLSPLLDKAWK